MDTKLKIDWKNETSEILCELKQRAEDILKDTPYTCIVHNDKTHKDLDICEPGSIVTDRDALKWRYGDPVCVVRVSVVSSKKALKLKISESINKKIIRRIQVSDENVEHQANWAVYKDLEPDNVTDILQAIKDDHVFIMHNEEWYKELLEKLNSSVELYEFIISEEEKSGETMDDEREFLKKLVEVRDEIKFYTDLFGVNLCGPVFGPSYRINKDGTMTLVKGDNPLRKIAAAKAVKLIKKDNSPRKLESEKRKKTVSKKGK